MKHNKNADTLLFLLSFTKSQREKNIERTFSVSTGAIKGWETAGSGNTLPKYLSNPKNKSLVKLFLHKVYLPYFQLAQKLKRFH